MKKKYHNIAKIIPLFALILMVTTGCGKRAVKEEIEPVYRFTFDEPIDYKAEITVDLTVEAGFISFSGEVGVDMDISLTAVDTNEYGYKIQVGIANPDVSGANSQISTMVIQALNFIRNYLSTIYITPSGKLTVFYNNTNHAGLESYASVVLPDFTDLESLWDKQIYSTNFAMKSGETHMVETFQRTSSISQVTFPELKLDHDIDVNLYDSDQYTKSVDPTELGSLELEYTDLFNYSEGFLEEKTGFFYLTGNMMISQGFFALNVSLRGNGTITMKRVINEVS